MSRHPGPSPARRGLVLRQALRLRRRATAWWSLGMVLLVLVVVAAWPTTRDSGAAFEDYVESLPSGLVELFGLEAGLASPAGYLNSQLYANLLPVLLLVLGIGSAAWAVAGSEADGTLEMLLANPVRRRRVALERFVAVVVLTGVVTLVATLLLAGVSPFVDLDEGLPASALWAAGAGAWALTLAFSSISFAVGAAGGSRGAALGAGGAYAAGSYVLLGLAASISSLSWARWASPWFWMLDADPLTRGFGQSWTLLGLPLLVTALGWGLGTARFLRRDLG